MLVIHKYCPVQFSHSVVSDSFWPTGLQHSRPPCPSLTPRVYSNSCPLSQWCHPTISYSVIPFSSCLQSFPASGSFPMGQFCTSGGQSIGVSALAPVLPKNIQDWFPLGWTGWISLQSKGLSRVFSNTTVQKHQFFGAQPTLTVQLSHPCMTTGKTISLTRQTFSSQLITILVKWMVQQPPPATEHIGQSTGNWANHPTQFLCLKIERPHKTSTQTQNHYI